MHLHGDLVLRIIRQAALIPDNCAKWFLSIIAIIKDHLLCSAAKPPRSTETRPRLFLYERDAVIEPEHGIFADPTENEAKRKGVFRSNAQYSKKYDVFGNIKDFKISPKSDFCVNGWLLGDL